VTRGQKSKKTRAKKSGARSGESSEEPRDETAAPLRPLERLLFEAAKEIDGKRILFTSMAGAQAAAEVARLHPNSSVNCNYVDVFLAESARERWRGVVNLAITCLADLPAGDADCVAIVLPAQGENQLARELIQTARQRLGAEGGGAGRLFVSTDDPKDSWVHEQLKGAFGKVTNRGAKDGRLYIASKPKPLKKTRQFDAWFAFRDGERLFEVMTRPGVFSQRKLDLGARALIESLTVPDGPSAGEVVQDGFKVLDLGCGSGAVGFAAAARADSVEILALDVNARAVQCARVGAEKNGIEKYATQLECQGECRGSGTFDLVLANPPYFSNYKIAEVFLKGAKRALKPGGRTHFVTKQPKWYVDQFAATFDDVSVREIRGYFIVKGTLPERRRKPVSHAYAQARKTTAASKSKSSAKNKPARGDIPKGAIKNSKKARRPRKSE
jgi:16S rRNA (guanine1207-N2)-methyltransferase